MRTELKSKFIQHLNRKRDNEGFTLVELLVVIIIIGILGAIALPSFLNQDVKAKQTEAKQNIALINKSQNAYRAEKKTFADSFDDLAIGSISGGASGITINYTYAITGTTDSATVTATTRDTALKGYAGANTRYTNGANQSVIGTVICQAATPGSAVPTAPTIGAATPTCASGQVTLSI
jgi:type IV pilus assembly protein PilA